MAADIKQLGTAVMAGIEGNEVTIPGVVIINSLTINEGYLNTTETTGHETAGVENVTMTNYGIDISVSGHLSEGAQPPKNGDTIAITGYSIAWIDGVSTAKVKDGLTVFSCTAHGRKKA